MEELGRLQEELEMLGQVGGRRGGAMLVTDVIN
jgi:hypothetical protein